MGVVLAALVFATISQGGLAVNALVPKQIVDVLQAVVIIAVAASVPGVRAALRKARASAAPAPAATTTQPTEGATA
jgi:simple sugar transport system permease protein